MRTQTLMMLAALAVTMVSCGMQTRGKEEKQKSVEQVLLEMRNDKEWVRTLDSLAALSIGPGARCLDAVKHTFSWDDRLWVYNQDWGGVLEIPKGYVPVDDQIQAELTYHGAGIFSPDSTVYITHYEGIQTLSYEEFKSYCQNSFDADSLMIEVRSYEESLSFDDEKEFPVLIFEALNKNGVRGYFKYIYSSPESVEYAVSLQYLEGKDRDFEEVRGMVEKYPFGPEGQKPKGEQLIN